MAGTEKAFGTTLRRYAVGAASLALLALFVMAAMTACSGGGKGDKAGGGIRKKQTETAIAAAGQSPTAAAEVATATPGESASPGPSVATARTSNAGLPVGGLGRPVERRSNVSASVVLQKVEVGKIAKQEALTFTFGGIPPTIRAEVKLDPPACGPSAPQPIEGAVAYLVIGLTPVTTTDFSGRPTLAATTVAGNGGTIISGSLTCEQDNSMAWTFGLTREVDFELGAAGDQAGVLLDPR